MLSAALYARVRILLPLHTRPRVQRAPGVPCALFFGRRETILKTSGALRREKAMVRLLAPQRRSAPSPLAGEGWGEGATRAVPMTPPLSLPLPRKGRAIAC